MVRLSHGCPGLHRDWLRASVSPPARSLGRAYIPNGQTPERHSGHCRPNALSRTSRRASGASAASAATSAASARRGRSMPGPSAPARPRFVRAMRCVSAPNASDPEGHQLTYQWRRTEARWEAALSTPTCRARRATSESVCMSPTRATPSRGADASSGFDPRQHLQPADGERGGQSNRTGSRPNGHAARRTAWVRIAAARLTYSWAASEGTVSGSRRQC